METKREEVDFDAELFADEPIVAMLKSHMLIERELTYMGPGGLREGDPRVSCWRVEDQHQC